MAINEYLNGALNFPKQYLLSAQKPLDSRIVVSTEDQLKVENFVDSKGNKFWYVGMVVSCQENGKVYVLKSETEGFVEVGKETEVPIKSISLNGQVQDIDENGNVELTLSVEDININLDDYYKKSEVYNKTEVDNTFATKEEIPSLDEYLKSADAESTYVKQEGYIAYTQEEKDKLAGIDGGAEVNYVKSVGNNLSVDADGKLTVTIPEVTVPFQSVSESDKILTLEDGILSAAVTFAKEEIEGQEYLVVRGKNNEELGKVSTAEFTADSFLDDVTIEDGNINFTWKMADGTEKTDSVDLSNYIKPYNADGETIELNAETNTFSVKDGVFAKSTDLATVATSGSYNDLSDTPEIPSIEGLATTTDVENAVADMATKTWVGQNFASKTEVETLSGTVGVISTKLDGIAEGAQVNVIETIKLNGTELEVADKTVNIDLSSYNNRIVDLENTSSESAENYTKALEFASKSENAGRVIYIANNETIEETEYIAGAYIVTGQNTLLRLSTTSATEETPTDAINRLEGLIGQKQDAIGTGSEEKPHVIWSSTDNKWIPGKIEIPQELPSYDLNNAGQVLTVDTDGSTVIWASAPISTTVKKNEATEETVETYTIAQGKTSVNVYSTEQIDSFFSWHNI